MKITFSTQAHADHKENRNVESLLIDGLKKRFHKIKAECPDKKIYMRTCCDSDEIDDMQFFLGKGFSMGSAIPVLKYDLTQDTKHYEIPACALIKKYEFDETAITRYLKADLSASTDLDAQTDILFNLSDPSFACYTAICDDEIIGAISIWNLSEERAATENIFVVPSHRRQNIARELISTAFDILKAINIKIATLSVRGENLSAIRLYLSCGYTLYYNLIEMIYE